MGGAPPRVRRPRILTRLAPAGIAILLCGLLPAGAGAADADEPIDPGRPALVTGVGIVRPGRVHLETGVAFERTSGGAGRGERRLAIEADLRAGITEDLEARVGGEPLVRLRGEEQATGAGDVTLGVKYRILAGQDGLPALGVLPSVTLPVADAPIGRERPAFGLLGLVGIDLPWRLHLDLNAGVEILGQRRPTGFLVAGVLGAGLFRDVGRDVIVFGETRLSSREERDGRDRVLAGGGLVWRLTPSIAVDAAVHAGLGDAPDYVVRTGLSLRLPR